MSGIVEKKVKVAVMFEHHDAFMGEFLPTDTLEAFIEALCERWDIKDTSRYMLTFKEGPQFYLCDANLNTLKNGMLLDLTLSAPTLCSEAIENLSSRKGKKSALDMLIKRSSDPTFVNCFVEKKGLQILMQFVSNLPVDDILFSCALEAFSSMLQTALLTSSSHWDMVDKTFVEKIVMAVESRIEVCENVLRQSLLLLERIVSQCDAWTSSVEHRVGLLRLMEILKTAKDTKTQVAVLKLLASLVMRASPERRLDYTTKLTERKYRSYITDAVLPTISADGEHSLELSRQLHRLQQLLLNRLHWSLMATVQPDDAVALEKILELRNVAFDADQQSSGKARREEIKKEYRKLGFRSDNPALDFNEVPPGQLALDNMHYFCQQHPEQYAKLVLENCYRADSHECPIGRASIELTKLLASILKIGNDPEENSSVFHPMLFTNDHPFEEMFCICITLLNKTWKEMKATTDDFSKVISVVREQVRLALEQQPSNLDQFHKRLQELTYERITSHWDNERIDTERRGMGAPQILKLKEQIRAEMVEVVHAQRLRVLQQGSRFRSSAKKRVMCCRLAPNLKFFHYDDIDDKLTLMPAIDDLTKKICVADIKSIVTGKDCLHNTKRKSQHAFSLLLETDKSDKLDFITSDEETSNVWQDGIKVLLRENISSPSAVRDISLFLEMELKLQLLDLEGVVIPPVLPAVPPPPPHYNFCYSL